MDMNYHKKYFKSKYRCPVCGRYYFDEIGGYEICPFCGWEDDPLQRKDPDFEGGANRLSLNEARRAFEEGDKDE